MPSYWRQYPNVNFIYRDFRGEVIADAVYVTRPGAFYHSLGCRWIQGREAKISLGIADAGLAILHFVRMVVCCEGNRASAIQMLDQVQAAAWLCVRCMFGLSMK